MDPETIRELASPLLNSLGIGDDPLISPMTGSAIKRTFKLHHEGLDYALKWYPPASPQESDPYQTEQRFYQFLKAAGIHHNPFALGWDGDQRISVLSLLHGRAMRPDEVNLPRTIFTGEFLAQINQKRGIEEAQHLPAIPPRESSISSLLDTINTFLLQGVPQSLEEVQPLVSFWEDELTVGWQKIIQHCLTACETGGLDPNTTLDDQYVWISPGEFTFHNAILTPEHSICFCDFDQARWGDPACIIARFFAQSDFLAKEEYIEPFLNTLDSVPGKDPLLAVRLRLLTPLIRVELVLETLFPAIIWELGNLNIDSQAEGKVELVQNIWQARQHLKAALRNY